MEQKVLTEYRIKNEEETRAFALALAQKLAAGGLQNRKVCLLKR